ncbi:MAG: hypothetical protein JJU45_00205 [Acidimicrobiia bacterium]|nr:hypothetical protein [Acidimicrobiia bacterium]
MSPAPRLDMVGDIPRARTDGISPTEELWHRLSRPFHPTAAVAALTGLPMKAAREYVGSVVATSPEAEELLARFPQTVRALATAMGTQAERCIGELRGPVLWSETLSARASSFGDPDLFVCAAPSRAYDIDQNRVLVAALLTVRDAARDALEELDPQARFDDAEAEAANHNGNLAARYAEHPSLRGVSRGTLGSRALKRTRSGKKRSSYEPAISMLARAAEPLTAVELLAVCDQRTLAQHALLVEIMAELEGIGQALPAIGVEQNRLYAGPVQYQHPNHRTSSGLGRSGVLVGNLLVDVPEQLDPDRSGLEREAAQLAARAGSAPSSLVVDLDDVPDVVARAVALATG